MTALCWLAPDAAQALVPPAGKRPSFQLAAGSAGMTARSSRAVIHDAPPAARAAYRRLAAALDPGDVMWDAATGVPLRIWGLKGAVPRAISSRALELRSAEDLLGRHLDLLAPGSNATDFVLVGDDVSSGIHSLGFAQHYHGRPVIGGQISFRFKGGRLAMIGSEALPKVKAVLTDSPVADAVARERAREWIAREAGSASADVVEGPFILPLVDDERVRGYREVLRVTVAATAPVGRWAVYVDAATGEPVAREQLLRFASGNLKINAPVRGPNGQRLEFAAANLGVVVNGAATVTSITGAVSFADGGPASVATTVAGSFVAVASEAGAPAATNLVLPPGGQVTWTASTDEFLDAQLTTYVHADRVKQVVRGIAPDFAFLDQQMPAIVNINDVCNAFADGETINFFRSDAQCQNSGRIADVVYHEFGHNVHFQGIIPGVGFADGALSEGISDFLSATITDSSALAPGFFNGSEEPLRELDPQGSEWHFPEDNTEIHDGGRIIGGALWDLRKALRNKLGAGPGVTHVNHLWFEAIRRATDMPTMYPEVLLADDDDGDLGNGTPNECEINVAFDAHGLVGPSAVAAEVLTSAPTPDGVVVDLVVSGQQKVCLNLNPLGAELHWRVRGEQQNGMVQMTASAGGFSGVMPNVGEGKVIEYQVRLLLQGGSTVVFPKNPADDTYELYLGPVTNIFCETFEANPGDQGWMLTGDWAFGPPAGGPDPATAFNGNGVAGNGLTPPGTYESFLESHMLGPVIDVSGHSTVRLQMHRWLEVEDATFDQALVLVNGEEVWMNSAGGDGNVNHLDGEWRFQDIDLTPFVANGQVQLEFILESDEALEFGGWNIDELCVVGTGSVTQGTCGDGIISGVEACDDGNLQAGDGCSPSCMLETDDPTTGPGPVFTVTDTDTDTDTDSATGGGDKESGCGCNQGAGDLGAAILALGGLVVLRRRRR
ncbi:DUF4215 domain-containing protein [Nannocystis radixulma]|uniref:DUF4215 domain-containing protein n=1 Tax=Nannocystis radixulma TaxID=2995305 RepID=A0ABT5B9G2_9BACT|nr:DUF4215 domain-containing protein [Nannocystis radixulma]MDC0670775.1 DUF4215 domain-containing protein [Nannocystis radixulma]